MVKLLLLYGTIICVHLFYRSAEQRIVSVVYVNVFHKLPMKVPWNLFLNARWNTAFLAEEK